MLFLGDSLTDWWTDPEKGGPVWDRRFSIVRRQASASARTAPSTCCGAFRTVKPRASPKLIILLIGTNNTGWEKDRPEMRNSSEETLAGVITVLDELQARFLNSCILHFAIFPRDEKDSLNRRQIEEINAALANRSSLPKSFSSISEISFWGGMEKPSTT